MRRWACQTPRRRCWRIGARARTPNTRCRPWFVSGTERKLASGTVNRRCRRAKQFFTFAVDSRYLSESPFAKLKTGQSVNTGNFAFVDPETTARLIEAAPDVQWRLIIALARYAGLRIPSELLPLKWSDVLWDQKRINVTSPKTAHQGKPERVIPLFPELETVLAEAYELAEPGDTHIITRYRDTTQNLRTTFLRIIRNAGVTPWPRLFQNLRSSRITELAEDFQAHVLDSWFGNTETVRRAHYLQTTQEHYDRATKQPTRKSDRGQKRGQTMLSSKRQPMTGSAANTIRHKKSPNCPSFQGLGDGPGGTRTHTPRGARDFKSPASANSATGPSVI